MDLFNHGYYWEAHEVWEGLWNAAGRSGITADFVKGLIKLAAAGVKVRQGQPRGVAGHAAGAAALFGDIARQLGGEDKIYLGLPLRDLLEFVLQIGERAATVPDESGEGVRVVFDFLLSPVPRDSGSDGVR